VIAWASTDADRTQYSVMEQRFNASAVKQGGEVRVDDLGAGISNTPFPAVSMDAAATSW